MTTNIPTRNRRFSHLALALALSAGTIGGMISLTAFTSPAFAQAAGGNGGGNAGGGNGPGGNGGEPGGVMNAATATQARNPNNPLPPRTPVRPALENPKCQGAADGRELSRCRYNQRSTPRIVSYRGFVNCDFVQRVPGADGRPAEFYCLSAM